MGLQHKQKHEEHENDERWLLTYADLITLLMVFFLVLYSMAQTDSEKFKKLAISLNSVFGDPALSVTGVGGQPIPGISVLPSNPAPSSSTPPRQRTRARSGAPDTPDARKQRIESLKNDLQSVVDKQGLSDTVKLKVDPRIPKLQMELADTVLFGAGSGDLTAQAKELMAPIGAVLAERDYNIHVEGHTDNIPISTAHFRNNFELSTARAVSVIDFLINETGMAAELFSASGYGEHRPLEANDTPEGRAKNRRVDFVIYDDQDMSATSSWTDNAAVEAVSGATDALGDIDSATTDALGGAEPSVPATADPAHETTAPTTLEPLSSVDTAAPNPSATYYTPYKSLATSQ